MAGTRDWKKEAKRLKEAMVEHQEKKETDPEYRKHSEECEEFLKKHLYMGGPPDRD